MQTAKPVKSPRKQRKQLFNAPAHLRHKLMGAPLAPDQIASKGVKTLPVRKGDTVRITRGDHKGFEGKVSRVDLKNYRVYIEGLTREKVDGTTIFVAIHPSKIIIKSVNLDDKWRKAIFEIKQDFAKKVEKKEGAKKKPETAEAKNEKPVEKLVDPVETKPEVPVEPQEEEKPIDANLKSTKTKAKAPAKTKEEKLVEEKAAPVKAGKPAEAKAEVQKKTEAEKKPARGKRVSTAAKKNTSARAKKKAGQTAEKVKEKASAKKSKATTKKAPAAKRKAKAKKEGET